MEDNQHDSSRKKTVILALSMIIIIGSILWLTWTIQQRLNKIQESAFISVQLTARQLEDEFFTLKTLRADLEKYDCSPYVLKTNNPEKYIYYRMTLLNIIHNLDSLENYLSIAYTAEGQQIPYELSNTLLDLSSYITTFANTLNHYAYSEKDKSLDCNTLLDNETIDQIINRLDTLANYQNISQVNEEFINNFENITVALNQP